MNVICQLFLILLLFFLNTSLFSSDSYSAKILMAKGEVKAQKEGNSLYAVQIGSVIEKGTTITTGEKSFAKLLYPDQSQINVGPKSSVVINEVSKEKPGIITVLKGQLQTTVTKETSPEKGDKFYVKTPSAAMGVRGTSFMTIVNEGNTSILTFSGIVQTAPLPPEKMERETAADLKEYLSSPKAVAVAEGQFVSARENVEVLTPPVKISPAQLDALKNNQQGDFSREEKQQKRFNSPVPPELATSKALINTQSQEIVKTVALPTTTELPQPQVTLTEQPSHAPLSGGFVDISTGAYIPPPPESAIDNNTGLPIPTASVGNIDLTTGAYLPPQGFSLNEKGEFITEKENVTTETVKEQTVVLPPPTTVQITESGKISIAPPKDESEQPKIETSKTEEASSPPEIVPPHVEEMVTQIQDKVDTVIEDNKQETIQTLSGNSKVIIFIKKGSSL